MHNRIKAKETPLTVLLVSVLLFSALAGTQFIGKASGAISYTQYTGKLDGADWALRIPDPWNGMLVLVCRGYAGPTAIPGPLGALSSGAAMLNAGFAVAASNYGAAGLSILEGVGSTYQLTNYIVGTYHVTGKIFLYGLSMGGAIVLLLAEKYPDIYSGVLDFYGLKDMKDAYAVSSKWANLTLEELAAELTAMGIPVPPPGQSVQGLKSFMALATNDTLLATGGTPATQPKAYEDRSPTYHANIAIPVMTVHGTADTMVLYSQSLKYQAAVAKAGRSHLYRLYNVAGAGHGTADISAEASARFAELVAWSEALTGWTLVHDGRSLKVYPDLKESVWQKNATMPPNGPYDKIGLHRLVKTSTTTKGAVFLLAGIYGSGEQLISNPPQSNYSIDGSSNSAVYWANRGFDVYSIDYRAHFLPLTMNATQASTIASNWGWDQYISDMKEAVEKAKTLSGYSKIFLAGMSFGGNVAIYYSSEYWKQDIKGVILLDGSEKTTWSASITNKNNVTSALNGLNATGGLALEYPRTPGPSPYPSGILFAYQNAVQNPAAPAEWPLGTPLQPPINPLTNKTWTNITEWFTYQWTSNNYCNFYAGYSNITVNIQRSAGADRYFPMRLLLESTAIHDWNNCPFVSYDFDDHYKEINVPMLGFRSALFGIPAYGNFTNGLATTDFTQITLQNYGHLDVVTGIYSAKDVSEPAYQWMLSHLSTLDVTARSSVTVLPGWTWWFCVQNLGGSAPYTYQWYEGMNPIQGQMSMVLPVTKTAPGVYSFYCRVTDKDGTTTTSNAVTLIVIG